MKRLLRNGPRAGTLATLLALTLAGCGESNGLVPVNGRVNYKGQPATGARIHFFRQDKPAEGTPIPSGIVDDAGHFELTAGDLGSGAPAGHYAVLVDWPEEGGAPRPGTRRPGFEAGSKLNKTPLDRLKGRYRDMTTPRIVAEVKPDSGELPPFDLTD